MTPTFDFSHVFVYTVMDEHIHFHVNIDIDINTNADIDRLADGWLAGC